MSLLGLLLLYVGGSYLLVGLAVYVARKLGVKDTDTLAAWFVLSPVTVPASAAVAVGWLLLVLVFAPIGLAACAVSTLLERIR